MMTFQSYGLHWIEGDIALLVQQTKIDHITGADLELDFKVHFPHKRLICPHRIDLSDRVEMDLPDHPLVRAFRPLPRAIDDPIIVIDDNQHNKLLVSQLSRLASPSEVISIQPIWLFNPSLMSSQLMLTNIQPLVVFGHNISMQDRYYRTADAAFHLPRRLVMMAPKWVSYRLPNALWIDTDDLSLEEVRSLPLEQIGAQILYDRMHLPKDV